MPDLLEFGIRAISNVPACLPACLSFCPPVSLCLSVRLSCAGRPHPPSPAWRGAIVEGEVVGDGHEGELDQGELGVGDLAEGEAAGCELDETLQVLARPWCWRLK